MQEHASTKKDKTNLVTSIHHLNMSMIPVYLVDQFQRAYSCWQVLPRSDLTFFSSLDPLCISSHSNIWVILSFSHLPTHLPLLLLFSCQVVSDSLQHHDSAAPQASMSLTISWSLPKFMCIESMILSNFLILCHRLFLLPLIFLSIRVFFNEQAGEGNDKPLQHICHENPTSCIKKNLALFYLINFAYIVTLPELSHTHTQTTSFLDTFSLPLERLSRDFPSGPVVKKPPSNAGDASSIPDCCCLVAQLCLTLLGAHGL